jgi:hypothetical protein
MTHDTLLQINQRDLMRKLGHVHTVNALDIIDPLPEAGRPWKKASDAMWTDPEMAVLLSQDEAGTPTQPNAPVSGDLFAPPIQSMPPASESPADGQERHAYGHAPGYEPSNWAHGDDCPSLGWHGMDPYAEPLLSRASCVDVEPEYVVFGIDHKGEECCLYPPKPWKRTWSLKKTDENGYESEYYRQDPRLYGIQSNAPGWSGWLVDAAGQLYRRTLPKHRFILSDGGPMTARAAQ